MTPNGPALGMACAVAAARHTGRRVLVIVRPVRARARAGARARARPAAFPPGPPARHGERTRSCGGGVGSPSTRALPASVDIGHIASEACRPLPPWAPQRAVPPPVPRRGGAAAMGARGGRSVDDGEAAVAEDAPGPAVEAHAAGPARGRGSRGRAGAPDTFVWSARRGLQERAKVLGSDGGLLRAVTVNGPNSLAEAGWEISRGLGVALSRRALSPCVS